MALQCIKNGNKHSPPELDEDVVKIVVIGEPQVGKSSFISAFYQHNELGDIYSHNGAKVYPCQFAIHEIFERAAIFEIPCGPDFFEEQRTPHYENVNAIVLMYAIDDPLSLQMLTDKWLPEIKDMINSKKIPVMLVGNKNDLRNDQEVIERLALDDKTPLTYQQGKDLLARDEIKDFAEISTNNLEEVYAAFYPIFNFAVYVD